ncbi:hypothetical protein Poli38472_002062 [Pythium oligandrum]|uniref:Transmembrane protein n=1 Tax=Pythium oligandrum TaxID=41045 RepID=A0A8K1FHV4_PYTOL|nr:hypothetical protein Poli38472_002062 [Pythium oligandrum]|eukprot:TMW63121.1 hypothetical protein Poli38472_002062 [Pythium oligandrum]
MTDHRGQYGAIPSDHETSVSIAEEQLSPLTLRVNRTAAPINPWEFPGWGTTSKISPDEREIHEIDAHLSGHHPKLSEWLATAICGNDILSSCLYVSGLVASKAGKLAPLALAVVAGVLYLYRFIYGEVVNAIPLNGGSYNVLLNTTTKRVASVAASLAILSYIATGVVSGTSACNYLASQIPSLPIVPATIVLLSFFALLSLIGITESAVFALGIFIAHTLTLASLCVASFVFIINDDFSILKANFGTGFPDINLAGDIVSGNFFTAVFFGTSTAMLGISGFESSSQFVEEQADGVFPKTLKNMWWSVAIFNPLISLLSLGVLPLEGPEGIIAYKDTVLARMGLIVAGEKMQTIVALDAFIVLSGAVLTAYVGIVGLVRRLASDRVLPAFLLEVNSLRHTNHFIIVGYFCVASSLVAILNGDTATLSGVYTYAFLGLMTLFGSGCMLLKFKRADLPRSVVAPWWSCILGVGCVLTTFIGNLLGDPTILTYFSLYFLSVLAIVMIMFERTFILRICMYCARTLCPSADRRKQDLVLGADPEETNALRTGARGGKTIVRYIREINEPAVFFFCKSPNLSTLNKAILYVRTNEQTHTMYFVHCYEKGTSIPEGFEETVALFDNIYLKIKMNFLAVEGQFGPAMVEWLSRKYKQPKNLMFVKQPNNDFAHTVASLGGVRVITG